MSSEILGFWGRETISNVRRNRLMSLLAMSTVTVSLFVLGAFYLAWGSLQGKVAQQARQLDLVVILDRDVTPARRKEIYEAAHIPQIAKLTFVSKQLALEKLSHDLGDISVADLQKDNPLGDELHLKLKNPNDILKVKGYLTSIKGVQKLRTSDVETSVVKSLLAVNAFVKVAGLVAFLVLGFGILLIIYNTIRLTIFARRREIRIMELVGATPAFIRVPFLMEGLIYGLAGAVCAAIILVLIFSAITRANTPLVSLLLPAAPGALLWKCLLWTLAAGLMFGLVGSWLSLSRSLNRSSH
jgi:cell division transport system permease protein